MYFLIDSFFQEDKGNSPAQIIRYRMKAAMTLKRLFAWPSGRIPIHTGTGNKPQGVYTF